MTRSIAAAIIAAILLVAAPPACAASAGTLDPGFGSAGVVDLDARPAGVPVGMVKTTDGKLAVAIQSGARLVLTMLTADGRLDPGFGAAGTSELRLADETIGIGVQRAPDGGVLVAATLRASDPLADPDHRGDVVAKVRPNGTLDPSYGNNGLAQPLLRIDRFAAAPDGSVVVLGVTGAGTFYGGAGIAVLGRFDPAGQRDTTFGVDGTAVLANTAPYPKLEGLAVTSDGGILVGETNDVAGPLRFEWLLRRFTPAGASDASFGAAGLVHVAVPGDHKRFTDVVVDDIGRIVCFGFTDTDTVDRIASLGGAAIDDPGFSPVIARLHPDGRPDTGFGRGGVTFLHTVPHGVRLGFSGDIVATRTGLYVTAHEERAQRPTSLLLRVDNNGALDTRFGGDQTVRLPMGNTVAVAATPDRVVVAGERSWSVSGTTVAGYRR